MPDKIALVTGSSSGFGLLTSVELARAGYRVVATMRDLSRRTKLDQTAANKGVPDKIDVRALDVTNFSEIATVVDIVVRDYGRIDVLVNNAGFAVAGFAEDVRLEELRLQFETNFFGAVAMTKAVLPTRGNSVPVTSFRSPQLADCRLDHSKQLFRFETCA